MLPQHEVVDCYGLHCVHANGVDSVARNLEQQPNLEVLLSCKFLKLADTDIVDFV